MAKQKTILIIANLDTRGEDFIFVKDLIKKKGHRAILLDFSMETKPPFSGDISCEQVAEKGGLSIDEVRNYYKKERNIATENQIKGATLIVQELLEKGEIDGVFGVGGGTSLLVATSIMKKLPLGMPKLMASPMASSPRFVNQCVGTRDITMHHTIFDIVGMNPLLESQIINAVGAICGMVEMTEGPKVYSGKPLVAISSFGFAEMCVQAAIGFLNEAGFMAVPCHAQGKGDRAMDEMIRQGMFSGVIDVVPRGLAEEMFDGNCAAGADRILAASESSIPQVISTSGFEQLSYTGRKELEELKKSRPHMVIDAMRVLVRTTPQELRQIARAMADRLNKAKAPFKVLIPLKGWSSVDKEGRALYDPKGNAAFTEELKKWLNKKEAVEEVNLHLYTPEFGRKLVDEFVKIFDEYKKSKRAGSTR
jgi:uncharacterized protein (UPF0261 family)